MIKLSPFMFTLLFGIFFVSCNDSSRESAYVPTSKNLKSDTYKFGVHPYLNSKKMYTLYRPILDFIETQMGDIEIILETSATYAEYDAKLYRGDFDFSIPNPFQTYNALSCGYDVIAKVKPDSVFRGIFIARKESRLKYPSQLKGKSISFPALTALAATMMPLLFLSEHGIDVNKDIEVKYVGSHYSSILNAFSGDTIAGATWPPPWETWKRENPKKAEQMEVVWETDSLINIGVVAKKSVDEKIVQKFVEILISLDKTPQAKELLYDTDFDGFTKSNNREYDIVSDFLKKYNKAVGTAK